MTPWPLHLVSWNLTQRCALRCPHCYMEAGTKEAFQQAERELSTERIKAVGRSIREVASSPMIILTGGEPLLRSDIFEIGRFLTELGATVVLGSSGIGLTGAVALKLAESGFRGAALSIDAALPAPHDSFRARSHAWQDTVDAAGHLLRHQLPFNIQTTVTRANQGELDQIAELACRLGCTSFNLFFLIHTGRGENLVDISREDYVRVLARVPALQAQYQGRMFVSVRCAPHFVPVVHQLDPESPALRTFRGGCPAGTHYCRITPRGEVTACPYMNDVVGDLTVQSFAEIWRTAAGLEELRTRQYGGKCGTCEYGSSCGGCRARAVAAGLPTMAADPDCLYEPRGGEPLAIDIPAQFGLDLELKIAWTPEARALLDRVPSFVRGFVARKVEERARRQGRALIEAAELLDFKPGIAQGGPFAGRMAALAQEMFKSGATK